MKHSGFSLIELMVSLAILATVTAIALRSTNGLQSQARYQGTTQSLNDIRSAIIGPANLRGPDGSAQVTGFVADTGRLPNFLIDGSDPLGANGDPLNELLRQNNSIPNFGFVSSNTDPSVYIAVGWQGPYLRLGAGPSYIRDGWGNSFHCYDTSASGIPITTGPIAQVSSWGSDNASGSTGDGYSKDVSIPNSDLTQGGFVTNALFNGRISINVANDSYGSNVPNQTGPAPNPTYTDSSSVQHASIVVWVCYYGPDLTQVSPAHPVVDIPIQVTGPNWQYTLSDPKITIGPRMLKAYVLDGSVVTNSTTFRAAVAHAPDPLLGPVFFVSALNITATGGGQTVPNLVLPHYSK